MVFLGKCGCFQFSNLQQEPIHDPTIDDEDYEMVDVLVETQNLVPVDVILPNACSLYARKKVGILT